VAGEAGADALVGALVGILDDGAVGGHVLLVAGGEGKAEVIRLSD
jgi:hypothetical protein